jgi:cyclopropane-fatty-acyl-phospholipid synthase
LTLNSAAPARRGGWTAQPGAERLVRRLLEKAGIDIGGGAPHDIVVHDQRVYARALRDGSLGLGEAYVERWWDSQAVDETLTRILRARLADRAAISWSEKASVLMTRIVNLQSRRRAPRVAERHYDIGNDLYRAMLDPRLVYTCGYWNGAEDLDRAQEAKLDLVCRKLGLDTGMRLLDLGCGFGSLAKYAAEKYGARVTGLTLSRQQLELGREMCAGLPVEIRLQDYREAIGTYDRVVSVGILEHVGSRNYQTYMKVVDRCLAPGGISLFHTIVNPRSQTVGDPWITRYVFPNSSLPSVVQLAGAMEGLFLLDDLHAFGDDYDCTLMAWYRNFVRAWPRLKASYCERFYRMWEYYLLMSAAVFRTRQAQLVQAVMSRADTPHPDCRVTELQGQR